MVSTPLRCDTNADCAKGHVCVAGYCSAPEAQPDDGISGADVPVPAEQGGEDPLDPGPATDPGTTSGNPADPIDVPVNSEAPEVTILSPGPDALTAGVMLITAEVVSSATIPEGGVRAVVDGTHHVPMTRVVGHTYSGELDTALLGEGSPRLDLVVLATDANGNEGRAASQFVVDNSLAVSLWVSVVHVVAGGTVQAGCEATRGGRVASDLVARLEVSPSAGPFLGIGGGLVRITPTQAGKYELRCVLDGGGVRSDPRILQVMPGPVVAIGTVLAESSFVAGQSTAVSCAPVDAYGNLVADGSDAALVAPDELQVSHGPDAGFVIAGTIAGDYEVACRRGTLVDEVPPHVMVLPGPPVATEAVVSPTVVRPTEQVDVACSMIDAFGNQVVSVQPHVVMAPPRGLPPEHAGVAVNGTSASATLVGFYHIYCLAMGYSVEEQVGVYVEVVPGLPARWDISFRPLGCSAYNRKLPIVYQVSDAWENEVPEAQLDIRTTPAGAVEMRAGSYFLVAPEGPVQIEVDVAGPQHVDSTIEPVTQTVMVDSKPPRITVETMELDGTSQVGQRGVMLKGGGMGVSDVRMSVRASDELSPITDLRFNDDTISVDGTRLSESFEAVHGSRWGMSTVTAIAKDACGNAGYLGQSYLRSPQYLNPGTGNDGTAVISRALVARLGQGVIDDDNRADLDDVCSIGEAALSHFDWNGAVPVGQVLAEKPRVCERQRAELGYAVARRAGNVVVDDVRITAVQPIANGFYFDVSLGELSVPLHMDACFPMCNTLFGWFAGCFPELDEDVTVGARQVHAWGELGIRVDGAGPRVDLRGINLGIGELIFHMDCGSTQSDCDEVMDYATDALKGTAMNMLEDAVRASMPSVLEDYISSFQVEQSFGVKDPIEVNLDVFAGLDELIAVGPQGSGHVDVGLYAQVGPPQRGLPDNAASRGAIVFGADPISYSFTTGQTFGIGVRVDLLNQVLWSIWYDGAMDVPQLTDLVEDNSAYEGIEASLFAYLPPIITPNANLSGVRVAVGDALINANVDLAQALDLLESPPVERMQLEIYASFVVGASFDIDTKGEHLYFTFDPEPEINLHVAVIEYAEYEAQLGVVFTHLLKEVMPQILAEAVVSFPLPELDLSDMVGRQSTLRLANGTVGQTRGYIRLQGGLQEVP